MLILFAQLSTNHTHAVVIGPAVVFVVARVLGGGVADHLASGGFEDRSSELLLAPPCSPRFAGFNVDGATHLSVIPSDSGGRQ
jgi:hypothetical protein